MTKPAHASDTGSEHPTYEAEDEVSAWGALPPSAATPTWRPPSAAGTRQDANPVAQAGGPFAPEDKRMSETLEHISAALADRYTIGREIGRGGMATVFAATDEHTGREVAIKVLHRDLTVALGPARFKREVEIASSLDHPHILPVLDSGVAGGSLYLVMPLVTGETLHDLLMRERQLAVEVAVRLTKQVADALAYAHERGIVHRDIKPENILLQDGQALVADFGIARATTAGEKLTQTGLSLGTPTYMSPEQAAAEKDLDGRSDQYSLACMLYEMLSGAPPYSAPTAQGLMARHALEAIPSISIVRNTVPDQIEDALYRALAKVPADRFPSVAEFGAALGEPSRWTTGTRAPGSRGGDRRSVPRGTADRRRSRVRRAVYSAALSVPMAAAGLAGWRYWVVPPAAEALTADAAVAARRVAVLYFEDVTSDSRLGPVADGLTEALIGQLQTVEALDVVSENGVVPFRGHDVEADSIARALRVGTIVRGEVDATRDGSVRVTVRLVDAASGADLDRTTIKQPAGELLALRDTVATKVAEFLRSRIGVEVRLRETRAGTKSVEAWTRLQRAARLRAQAEALWRASDTVASARALDEADSNLVRAATLDPRWSEPLVERAATARLRAQAAVRVPLVAGKWLEAGIANTDSALRLNTRDAGALELRGTLRYARLTTGLAPDPSEAKEIVRTAEQDLRNAVKLDPNRASAWVALSQLSYRKLDIIDANLAARRAYEADAYLVSAPDVLWRLFATSYDLEQAVDANHWCAEGQRRFAGDARFLRCQLLAMTMRGTPPEVDRAWRLYAELERRTPKPAWPYEGRWQRMIVAAIIARGGMADSARHVLVSARADRDVDPRGELIGFEAFVRSLVGDKDEAIAMLKGYLTANPEHREGFAKLNTWWWRELRNDPRFGELVGPA